MSLVSSSVRSRLKRPTVLLAAGVAAAALVFGGTLAANAAPGPSLTLAPTTATVNGTFDATVDGFQPNELVTFTLGSETQTGTTDGNGQLKESLWVPQGTALGPVTVQATGTTTPVQSAQDRKSVV